jgi:Fe-S cluster assembly iron-binding protein IscA
MEGRLLVTTELKNWLIKENQTLILSINSKGCNGNTITQELVSRKGYNVSVSQELCRYIEQGLELKIDYVDEPLFKRVEVSILNKDTCGCGISFDA